MTQEEKQLLLKDICARLPYQLTVNWNPSEGLFKNIESNENSNLEGWLIYEVKNGTIKPYLRPMSSMTEEEREEFEEMFDFPFAAGYNTVTKETIVYDYFVIDKGYDVEIGIDDISLMLDWLISHHFDCHNLIQKGLALEATENMYKTE